MKPLGIELTIGTRVRIRPDRLYLIGSLGIQTGIVTDRSIADLGFQSGRMPMLRVLRDGQRRAEEWSENFWEPDERCR